MLRQISFTISGCQLEKLDAVSVNEQAPKQFQVKDPFDDDHAMFRISFGRSKGNEPMFLKNRQLGAVLEHSRY